MHYAIDGKWSISEADWMEKLNVIYNHMRPHLILERSERYERLAERRVGHPPVHMLLLGIIYLFTGYSLKVARFLSVFADIAVIIAIYCLNMSPGLEIILQQ